MEAILALVIPALSGAVGGNIIGKVSETLSGGGMMNTILGAVGGLGAGSILGAVGMDPGTGAEMADAASNMDIGALVGGIAGGAGGGAVLGGAGGLIKGMLGK